MFMNQKKTHRPHRPKKPKAIREYTAGGVVYRPGEDGTVDILMIQDRAGRWTIPKGHVEEGERLEQTAVREVGEETGLTKLKIRDKLDKIHFFYSREGKLIFMTTHVYLMQATDGSEVVVPEESEGIADAKWFNQEEALKLIEYKDTERLFRLGIKKVKSYEHRSARA